MCSKAIAYLLYDSLTHIGVIGMLYFQILGKTYLNKSPNIFFPEPAGASCKSHVVHLEITFLFKRIMRL